MAASLMTSCARRDRYAFAQHDIDTLEHNAIAEIVTLHEFFQDWYRGKVEDTDDTFDRLMTAMHADFKIVVPDASVFDREQIASIVRAQHKADPEASFSIEDISIVSRQRDIVICQYTERRSLGDQYDLIKCTAVFKHDRWAPNNVQWLALQETFVPSGS
jgi:hypothetical protein